MKQNRQAQETDYTPEKLQEEREYGLFWYSWLWAVARPLLIALCVALVVLGVVMSVWHWVDASFLSPVAPDDPTEISFTVTSGSSLTRVANNLEEAGLIHNRTIFKYYADFLGFGQKIQAGEYKVRRDMRMTDIMDLLTTGDGNPITRNITIIPGWTVADIAAYLLEQGVIEDVNTFLTLCRDGREYAAYYYIADVLATPDVASRRYTLEGYLAPDTYEIYTNASMDSILRKLLSQTEAVFRSEYHDRADELGMTMDEIITLASMIEKEAKQKDFARVSAVFHNRLRQNMTLGSDVTVKYYTGTKHIMMTNQELQADSPYNTYTRRGLPVGPICSPSAAAIQAALYPDEQFMAEGYLYFCATDPNTGDMYFSKTLEEHNLAVSIYAPLWQAFDREHGL